MDRGRNVLKRAFVALALGTAACVGSPESSDAPRAADLTALRWLAPEADRVRALTALPRACETAAADAALAAQRRLGKLAFESPALLGGAAGRMGLSCSSCHLNGRGNPDFFLDGVSGAPGTADVTSSLLSKVRGDGTFNPVAIPDLGLRDGRQTRERTSAAFLDKVRGLIVEEFDGQEPPPAVFEAMIAYLDGLDPEACVAGQTRRTASADLAAAKAAESAAAMPDMEDAGRIFYLRVARSRLEDIHERLPGDGHATLRAELVTLSSDLGGRAEAIRVGRSPIIRKPEWERLQELLEQAEERSLYNPEVLRAALAAR